MTVAKTQQRTATPARFATPRVGLNWLLVLTLEVFAMSSACAVDPDDELAGQQTQGTADGGASNSGSDATNATAATSDSGVDPTSPTASGGTDASTGDSHDDTGDTNTTSGTDVELTSAAEMFSLATIPNFHITLDDAAIAALANEPKVYVQGGFRYRNQDYPAVGVRLKGNISLTTLDEKPSLKVKFNEYIDGTKFLGLKKLTMHNMFTDASMLHEWLGYLVFRSIGVPAPRTGYVHMWINGIDYGLYLNVETPDDKWLEFNFGEGAGNLYEGEHGDDLNKDVSGYEQDEGEDKSRDDLRQLHALATQTNDDLFYAADTVLDLRESLAFLAGEAFVGHFDGYWSSHNYFLHHDLVRERWSYHPWSLDQAFSSRVDAFGGDGYLKTKCLDSKQCLVDYVHAAMAVADTVEGLDLSAEIDRVLALIDEAAHADPRKRHDNASMESRQRSARSFATARPGDFRKRVDCLVNGQDPDVDGDGFGACFKDCNDGDVTINPDAPELCDLVDNDCSGYADDVPECPCPSLEFEGATFYFCAHSLRWTEAAKFCAAQGHQLARFDSVGQNDAVAGHAASIAGGRWAIGLNDRSTENTYVWQDASSPSFDRWAADEPAHLLAWFDCGFFRSGGAGEWEERNCVQSAYFICR